MTTLPTYLLCMLSSCKKIILMVVSFLCIYLPYLTYAATFNDNLGTGFKGRVESVVPQQDNKLIVGGAFSYKDREYSSLVRLNQDGTEDTEFFNNLGNTFLDPTGSNQSYALKVALQSDGKILAGGRFAPLGFASVQYGLGLVRVNSNGTDDISFRNNIPDILRNTVVFSFVTQEDGKIVVTGRTMIDRNFSNSYTFVMRLNKDGSEDINFAQNYNGIIQNTSDVAIQSDGKILVAGFFNSFNGNPREGLIRLNSDGTEDLRFSISSPRYQKSAVKQIHLQSDGKIVANGNFVPTDKSLSSKIVMRYNQDGTEDIAFTETLGGNYRGVNNSTLLQSDGKILVAGLILDINGLPRKGMLRLNQDGTEDTVFDMNLGKGFDNSPTIVGIQNNGKILLGMLYDFNGNKRNGLVRLNPDGTEDTSGRLPPPAGIPPRGGPRGGPLR